MALTSEATTVWTGTLFEGSGNVALDSSGLADVRRELGGARRGRREHDESRGTARRRALVVLLDGPLARARRRPATPPESIQTTAAVTFEAGKGVLGSHLLVSARVPGITEEQFEAHRRGREGELPDLEGAVDPDHDRSRARLDRAGAHRRRVRLHRYRPRRATAPPTGTRCVRLVRRRAQGTRRGVLVAGRGHHRLHGDGPRRRRGEPLRRVARAPAVDEDVPRRDRRLPRDRDAHARRRDAQGAPSARRCSSAPRPSASTATGRASCSPSSRAPARGSSPRSCGRWESAAASRPHETRTVVFRTGIVVGHGGAHAAGRHAHPVRPLGAPRHRRPALAVDRPRRRGRGDRAPARLEAVAAR